MKMNLQLFGGGHYGDGSGGGFSHGGGGAAAAMAPAGATLTVPFSAEDDGPFRSIDDPDEYYAKQNLTASQMAAVDSYTNPNTESGSLYNFSQNMNYAVAHDQPLTGEQQKVFDELMGSMHNLGQNTTLTRYDHDDAIQDMMAAAGVSGSVNLTNLKKMVGKSYSDKRILSTSHDDFKNSDKPETFNTRHVKITYQAKAGTQAMMPGQGKTPMKSSGKTKGDDFGEVLLAPTGTKGHNTYTVKEVKYSGAMSRKKGHPTWDLTQKQIEIVVEVG